MKLWWLLVVLLGGAWQAASAWAQEPLPADPAEAFPEAEAAYAEGRYGEAALRYADWRDSGRLGPGERAWVRLRLRDLNLRLDAEPVDAAAREGLQSLIDELAVPGLVPNEWVAEAWLALGDARARAAAVPWGQVWPAYEAAFARLARSTVRTFARERYLEVFARLSRPTTPGITAWREIAARLPTALLNEVLALEPGDDLMGRVHFLKGLQGVAAQADPVHAGRVAEAFAAAMRESAGASWEQDLLYAAANWQRAFGFVSYNERGDQELAPDYEAALRLYERLQEMFPAPTGRYTEEAAAAIAEITAPRLELTVEHAFTPDSEPSFRLAVRNLRRVEIELFAVTLVDGLAAGTRGPDPLASLDPRRLVRATTRRLNLEPLRPYYPVAETVRVEAALAAGAYLVVARAPEGPEARDLLLMTDVAVVAQVDRSEAQVFAATAADGEPLGGARVLVLREEADGWGAVTGTTDAQGFARVTFATPLSSPAWFVAVDAPGGRQTVARSDGRMEAALAESIWSVPVFTARTVYQRGEEVPWRAVVRVSGASGWELPEQREVGWVLEGPEGRPWLEGRAFLDAEGIADEVLTLDPSWPAGPYRLYLQQDGQRIATRPPRRDHLFTVLGSRQAGLEVTVRPAATHPEHLQPGEDLSVRVQASHASGAPVVGAAVTVEVVAEPLFAGWPQTTFADGGRERAYALETDSTGLATLAIETNGLLPGARLRVRARVVQGEEAMGEGMLVAAVSRQHFFAHLANERQVYAEGEAPQVTLTTRDATAAPVPRLGELRLVREQWREVWVDRRGREITGSELRELRRRSRDWFFFGPSPGDYRLREQGYEAEELVLESLRTGLDGTATYTFGALPVGYYRAQWLSRDRQGQPIKAEAAFWVGGEGQADLGYRPEGVHVIPAREVYREGETLSVLVTLPVARQTVFLTAFQTGLRWSRVVPVEGNAALVEIPLTADQTPRFHLYAYWFNGARLFSDVATIEVQPESRRLRVELEETPEAVRPETAVSWTVKVTDAEGRPVSAAAILSESWPRTDPDGTTFFAAISSTVEGQARGYLSSLRWKPFAQFAELPTEAAHRDETASVTPSRPLMPPSEPLAPVATVDLWPPLVRTDDEGRAAISLTAPARLGRYPLRVHALAGAQHHGAAETTLVTRLPVVATMEAPPELRVGDVGEVRVRVEALAHDPAQPLTLQFQAPPWVEVREAPWDGPEAQRTLANGEEATWTWRVQAVGAGRGELAFTLAQGDFTTVARQPLAAMAPAPPPAVVATGRSAGDRVEMVLPSTLAAPVTLQVSPSLVPPLLGACAQLRAGPGQTVAERWHALAAPVAVTETLRRLGLRPDRIARHLLATAEHGNGWRDLSASTAVAWQRLASRQLPGGGWPWREGGAADPWTSGLGIWSLALLQQSGVALPTEAVERARTYAETRLQEPGLPLALRAFLLRALAARLAGDREGRPTRVEAESFLAIMDAIDEADVFTVAMTALAALDLGFNEDARLLGWRLERAVYESRGRARWGESAPETPWYNRPSMVTPLVMSALLQIDPQHPRLEPALAWLLGTRTGPAWETSWATTFAALALREYLIVLGELDAVLTFVVEVNGAPVGRAETNLANVLTEPSRFALSPAEVAPGDRVTVRRESGAGPINYALWHHPPRDPSPADADAVRITREAYRLIPVPTLLRGTVEERRRVQPGETLAVGDRLEIVTTLFLAETQEALQIVDPWAYALAPRDPLGTTELLLTPAGGLPGETWLVARPGVDREVRADQTALYARSLPAGNWQWRYQLQATAPGVFTEPPAVVTSLRDPRVNAVSTTSTWTIEPAPTPPQATREASADDAPTDETAPADN